MKYTKFTIINFKGITKIELDLKNKSNLNIFTLVGLNESGKTSILEAINVFRNGINKEDIHTLIPKSLKHEFNDIVCIRAELEFAEYEIEEIKKYLKFNHNFNIEKIKGFITISREYKFKSSEPCENNWINNIYGLNIWGKSSKGKKNKKLYDYKDHKAWKDVVNLINKKYLPKILYYQDFLFRFPRKIYLEELDNASPEQQEYRQIIADILKSIGDNLSIEESLLNRMKATDEGTKDALESLLNKILAKLNNEILRKWEQIFGTTSMKEVVLKYEHAEDNNYYLTLKIKQGDDSYFIDERSLGFSWFFSFLIFTVFRKSRSSDPGETLFLLDEPASNLHQSSQQKLLLTLGKIVSNCKLIYSTHSHHLINPIWLPGTFIVNNKAISYSDIGESNVTETDIDATLYKNFVANGKNDETHFKPILDALQYCPSKLELVKSIVFTEGKNDYYVFKYFSEVIFEKKYDINFYPGGGANKYDQIFRLYIAWNKKFIALFDSDKGGQEARAQYIHDITSDIANKIFTFESIDSNWKKYRIENLFTETERDKIIKSYYGDNELNGNHKKMLNTAIENLYISKDEFTFDEITKDKFRKIFEFLEAKLSEQ